MNKDILTLLFKETIYLRLLVSGVAIKAGFSENEWHELCKSARVESEREYLDCRHRNEKL